MKRWLGNRGFSTWTSGRPAFDHVLMFKVLLLQAMHALSDERAEYLIKDRLSFMRFLGLGLGDPVPDANTIWTFRESLKRAGAADVLFAQFDAMLRQAGYLAMGGQIVDASIIAAPKQRNTEAEKAAIKAGQIPRERDSEAGQAAAEGQRCAMDGEVQQGEAARWRRAPGAPMRASPPLAPRSNMSSPTRKG